MVDVGNNQWDSRLAFLLAMIGAAIGLGNIWRYPYIAYTNGGGSFLIPYFTAILILGIPFLLLEYGVGFRFKTSLAGALKRINGRFEFLGWFVALTAYLILVYYVCVVGWDLIYIVLSFFRGWGANPSNFFTFTLLSSSDGFSGVSYFSWPVVLALIVVWVLIWLVSHVDLNKGIARVSKVFIPLLVCIMGFIVFFSLSLPGSSLGLSALLTPRWSMLLSPSIWLAAFGQILFSLSLGIAVIITYTSYLPEGSNLIGDGLTVVCANCGFELFTAFGIFSILGFMALNQGVAVSSVVTQGSGLIFIAIPTVLNIMGVYAYIIGPLFFLCVFFAGMTTTISYLEPLVLSISRKFNIARSKASSLLCLIGFIVSLIFATGSGNYILTIFDGFVNQFGILFGIICQCLIFGWYYNIDLIIETINKNSRRGIGGVWKFVIRFLIPIILFIVWFTGLVDLFASGDFNSLVIQLLITLALIVIPSVFTLLPSGSKGD